MRTLRGHGADAKLWAVANTQIARVHLPVLGQMHAFELHFEPRPTSLTSTLDVARELAAHALTAAAEVTGQAPTCVAGCAACCRHLVMLTVPEALAIANAVHHFDEPRRAELTRRFGEALALAERAGIFGPRGSRRFLVSEYRGEAELAGDVARRYFALQIACPFLEQEACSIYELRPLACREHNVSSMPDHCTTFDHPERRGVPSLGLARAVALAAERLVAMPRSGVPLPTLLEWYQATDFTTDVAVDGVAALRALLGALGEVEER